MWANIGFSKVGFQLRGQCCAPSSSFSYLIQYGGRVWETWVPSTEASHSHSCKAVSIAQSMLVRSSPLQALLTGCPSMTCCSQCWILNRNLGGRIPMVTKSALIILLKICAPLMGIPTTIKGARIWSRCSRVEFVTTNGVLGYHNMMEPDSYTTVYTLGFYLPCSCCVLFAFLPPTPYTTLAGRNI